MANGSKTERENDFRAALVDCKQRWQMLKMQVYWPWVQTVGVLYTTSSSSGSGAYAPVERTVETAKDKPIPRRIQCVGVKGSSGATLLLSEIMTSHNFNGKQDTQRFNESKVNCVTLRSPLGHWDTWCALPFHTGKSLRAIKLYLIQSNNWSTSLQ